MSGIGNFLWKISVALYLIANGALGLMKRGDFKVMFGNIFKGDVSLLVIIAGIIALIAGIAILLEMFNIQISFLDTLILIIAVIWLVFLVFEIVGWLKSGFSFDVIQKLAVHLMVLASLMIASKKFG